MAAHRFTQNTKKVDTQYGQPDSINLALPHVLKPVRRKLLAAMGFSAAGVVTGLPNRAHSANTTDALAARFADSLSLATTLVRKALDSTETNSISMALISQQGLVWAKALGDLGDTAKTPATTETLYCIGSCSKLLATVAALQLVDRTLLQLDAPIVHYLPAFSMLSPQYKNVTVRMLLNHQSGFPGSDYSNAFTTLPFAGYADQVLQTLSKSRLKHLPGEMSVYCNDGFTLVELVVRSVTGLTYHDYVQRNILDPLGMTQSRFAVQLLPKGEFAPGYSPDNKAFLECINVHASGGLFTTPSEMAHFAQIFLHKGKVGGVRLLSEASVQAMSQLQAVNESLRPVPVDWGFGLGWDDVRQGAFAASGLLAWRKNGGTSVYGSDFYVLPDQGLAFMITGTSSDYKPDAIAEQVLYRALVDQGSLKAPPAKVSLPSPSAASAYAVKAADLQGIFINYQSIYKISAADAPDTLDVQKWDEGQWSERTVWKRRPDGLFAGADKPKTAFGQANVGEQRFLTLHTPSGGEYSILDIAFAQAVSPHAPMANAWAERLDRPWVVINEKYTSLALAGEGPRLTLSALPELPGYIVVNAAPSTNYNQLLVANEAGAARMFMKIPYTMSRDLNDVLVETIDGQEHLRFGRLVFKALDAFPELAPGSSFQARINEQGHAVGLRVNQTMPLEVTGVLAALVYSAEFEPVFPDQFRASLDGVVSVESVSGTVQRPARVTVPKGGVVLVYGELGNVVSVKAVA